MGVDVYAISDSQQPSLDMELESLGLNSDLRGCNINVWKGIFHYCTGEHICDYQWLDDIPIDKVKEWAIKARNKANDTAIDFTMESCVKKYVPDIEDATIEDINKLCKYLDTCVKYNAIIRVC